MSALLLRRSLVLAALGTALTVGACSRGGKSEVPEIAVAAESLDLSGADARALERHFQLEPRGGTEADTLAVLAALGLDGVTDGRSINGSTASYAGWSARDGDTRFTAETLTLRGLHMEGGEPTFDALDAGGISLEEREAGASGAGGGDALTTGTVERLLVVEPTPEFAADLAAVLRGEDAPRAPDPLGGADGPPPFRALRLDDADIRIMDTDAPGTATLELLVVGNDEDAGTVDMIVDSVSLDIGEPDTPARLALSMDGLTALDVAVEGRAGAPALPGPLGAASFLAPGADAPYREIDLGALSVDTPLFSLRTDGFEASSEEAGGGALVLRSVLMPTVVDLKDGAGTPLAPFMESFRANGLAEMTLKGSQTNRFDRAADRVSVENGQLEIDEGLRLDCDYALRGLQAAADALEASGARMPDTALLETEAGLDQYLTELDAFQTAQGEANGRILIEALDCTVQDVPGNSLVTRGYQVASDVTGRPVAVLKGSAKTLIALSSLTAQSEFQRDLMDSLGSGLIDFIDTPGQTLRIRMAPEAPVSIGTLSGPDASLDPLNLSVTVE